jgi:enoyl-CoA hydratase/carnithine racemase
VSNSTAGALLERADDGPVARVTLSDPARRNALSLALMDAIIAELAIIAQDDSIHCLVVAAEGNVFCAGHDLREIEAMRSGADGGRAGFERTMATCTRMMLAIPSLPKPVIACVDGLATAAGCQLVASCDLAIASDRATFCTPGVNIGLFCSTPSVALLHGVAFKPAMEMLLTGEPISAQEAHRIGLVNHVFPANEALGEAMSLAQRLATKSPEAIRRGKGLISGERVAGLAKAYASAGRVMVENMLAADAIEGIGAFLQKRPPNWRV